MIAMFASGHERERRRSVTSSWLEPWSWFEPDPVWSCHGEAELDEPSGRPGRSRGSVPSEHLVKAGRPSSGRLWRRSGAVPKRSERSSRHGRLEWLAAQERPLRQQHWISTSARQGWSRAAWTSCNGTKTAARRQTAWATSTARSTRPTRPTRSTRPGTNSVGRRGATQQRQSLQGCLSRR